MPAKIILPHSGYKKLIQMTQAARSCKQNIAEGSAAAGTSLETQLKLTNVARATLDELLEDYLDYLKAHEAAEWSIDSKEKTAAREFAKEHADWEDWKPLFESRPATTLCNLMIVLIQQTRYLLDKMLAWQETDFKLHGGVRERMHAARTEARAEAWSQSIYSMLDLAQDSSDLARRLDDIMRTARRTANSIARRKGWTHP